MILRVWSKNSLNLKFKWNSWQHWVFTVKLGIFSNTSNILNLWCLHFISFRIVPISLDTEEYRAWEQKAQLAATLIEETQSIGHQKLIESTLRHLLSQNTIVQEVFYNTTNTLKHWKKILKTLFVFLSHVSFWKYWFAGWQNCQIQGTFESDWILSSCKSNPTWWFIGIFHVLNGTPCIIAWNLIAVLILQINTYCA